MPTVRCEICRVHLTTSKSLKNHYMERHSKLQLIREIFKLSILHATPKTKTNKKRKYKKISLHDNVQITCTNETIVIVTENNKDNSMELIFEDSNRSMQAHQGTGRSPIVSRIRQRTKKPKKLFHIEIQKVSGDTLKSLDERTGEFYECHCMEKSSQQSSDTESVSDCGMVYFCGFCSNGYQTQAELSQHEKQHKYYCRLCNKDLTVDNYKEHVQQHLLKIYVCHLCGFEFVSKEILAGHLWYHFEQRTLDSVIDMERDYNMNRLNNSNFSVDDYYSNMNSILFFLSYPYNHLYSHNAFL